MCRLFLCIPIFRGFFRLKSVKKCVCVINLSNAKLPMRSVFIKLKKGISKLWCSLVLIHTTYVPHVSDGDKVLLI